LFFMGLGCQHDTQPLVCRTRVSLCLEPQSWPVWPGRHCQ
jgi:hypothetical protein